MTVTAHGLSDDGTCLVFTDNNGRAVLPFNTIRRLTVTARNSDDETARDDNGRTYHRDVLIFLDNTLDRATPCDNHTASWHCDKPAAAVMADGRMFCAWCRASAAGSIYDDKETF